MHPPGDYACVSLQMTDCDVVTRAAEIMGCNVNGPYCKPGKKPTWACRVHGKRAIQWAMTLFGLMGARRKEQILVVLERWKAHDRPRPTGFRGKPFKKAAQEAKCHPGKRVVGWGLCGACYMREWRAQRRVEVA